MKLPNTKYIDCFIILSLVFITPFIIGTIMYFLLMRQPINLWARVMPQTIFSRPALDQNIIILTRKNTTTVWDFSSQSHYTYPNGQQTWIVLKETISMPKEGESGGLGAVKAVDDKGRFFVPMMKGSNILWRDMVETDVKKLEISLETAVILVQDKELLEEMEKRIPKLKNRTITVFFNDAFVSPTDRLTILPPTVIVRIASFAGYIFSGIILITIIFRRSLKHISTAVFIGLSLLLNIDIPLVVIFSVLPGWFYNLYPYLLWICLGISTVILYMTTQKNVFVFHNLRENAIKYLHAQNIAFFISLSLFAIFIFVSFLNSSLTTGDSVRYVNGSMTIYDSGGWRLNKIIKTYDEDIVLVNYPPANAALFARGLWMSNTEKNSMYFPGIQTGSALIVYALILLGTQLSFVLALISTSRLFMKPYNYLWILGTLILIFYIPSLRGVPHAAETLLWPLFGNFLLALINWKYTKLLKYAFIALVLSSIMVLVKPEAILILATLGIGWILWCLPKIRLSVRKLFVSAVSVFFVFCPYILWTIQKFNLNVHLPFYEPFSLKILLSKLDVFIDLLFFAFRFSLRSGIIFSTIILFTLLNILRIKKFGWQNLVIPVAVTLYIGAIITTYVFSNYSQYPSAKTVVIVSWNRLLVYLFIVLIFYCLDLLTSDKIRSVNRAEFQ